MEIKCTGTMCFSVFVFFGERAEFRFGEKEDGCWLVVRWEITVSSSVTEWFLWMRTKISSLAK